MSTKNNSIVNLYRECEIMLDDFGFSTELYIITKDKDYIDVEFDDKGAVEYFRDEAEKDKPDTFYIEYIRKGKRHCARVYYY